MLGKLIKYEFRATGRVFLPMFGALIIVAVINRLFSSLSYKTPMIIGTATSVVLIIAIFVITLIITLQRFYKNLLTNEGYLMFTLPVSTDSLIFSKLITASVWNILSLIIVAVAVCIMAVSDISLSGIIEAVSGFLADIGIGGITAAVIIVEAVVVALSALLSGILMFYACMSVSLLMNKHRILFSFVAFLVFNTVGQILGGIAVPIAMALKLEEKFLSWDLMTQIHSGAGRLFLQNLIVGAVFYILSRFMLKKKLNLE